MMEVFEDSTQVPMSLRRGVSELAYQVAKIDKKTQPLELASSIRQWEHWRLINNEFPYDICLRTHHMLLPKRTVAEPWELNLSERSEFDQLVKDFVYPNYDVWFTNTPQRRSMNHIYHVHLGIYFESRDDMQL